MILEVHLDEAREYLRSVLNELTPRYPANHPLIASVWNELGIAYCDSGLYAEGSSAFRKSVDMEQHLSANPLRVAMMYGNLGSAYRDAGNLHDALASLDKAINMMISASDDKNVNLKGLYYEQAATHRLLGNLSAAEKSLQAGERLLALSDDMTDPNRYFVLLERGRWLTAKGKAALAVTKLQSTLDETPKEAKRLLANIYLALGEALDHTSKCDEAIRQIRTAYDIRKTVLPATNWYIYEAENSLGNTLSKCGHIDEAQPLLTNSVEKLRQQRPKNDISLAMAERNLAAHEQRIKK
jgi:tetratricopeptide (TPR) repeat protein